MNDQSRINRIERRSDSVVEPKCCAAYNHPRVIEQPFLHPSFEDVRGGYRDELLGGCPPRYADLAVLIEWDAVTRQGKSA